MDKKERGRSWTTKDEMKAISYMASKKAKGVALPSTDEEIAVKLKTWLATSKTRIWNELVDVDKCRAHAESLIR